MEDGSSLPLWGIIILFMLFLLNGVFYGFAAAVQNLSEGELQRRALEGDKKAVKLLEFMNHPSPYVNAIPLMVISSGICFGTFFVPWAVREFHPYIKHIPAMLLVLIPGVILLAALGILTFRRIGSFSPERFAYRWLGIVSFFSKVCAKIVVSF